MAQDPPPTPTGIQTVGSIAIIRAEGLIPAILPGSSPTPSVTELFTAGFQSLDYTNYTPPAPPDPSTINTIGPCTVTTIDPTRVVAPSGVVASPLDAGPVVNLSGPNGKKQFPLNKGTYGGPLSSPITLPIPGVTPAPPYLSPGTYTVDNGSGGADIAPFNANLTVPDPMFTWTNPDAAATITRSDGVDITFSGGDPNANVSISGSVSLLDAAFKVTGGAAFICIVPNTGEFFISSDVLNLLPATVPASLPSIPTSTLTVSQGVRVNFDAPISTTNVFSFSTGVSRNVTYK